MRVIHRGAWGFAAGVVLTPEEAVHVAERAIAVAVVAAEMTTSPVEIAPEPVHDDVTWVSAYDVNPLERADGGEGSAAHRLDQPAAWPRGRPARDGVAAAGAGEQVLRRPDRHPHHPAADPAAAALRGDGDRRVHRRLRLHVLHRAAGGARLGVPHRRQLRLGRRAGGGAGPAGREARGTVGRGRPLRPGHPPVQPLAHDPRVDRPRHRARPRAGLRGQLRRHVVRDLRQAPHAPVRLPGHERHRRPHRPPRPLLDRVRRRGGRDPGVGHRARRGAGRLPARPGDGAHEGQSSTAAAPTGAPTPTPPATSRSSGWPTSRSSPPPTTSPPRT